MIPTEKNKKQEYLSNVVGNVFDSRLAKTVLFAGIAVGIIFLAKHIMNHTAETIRAYKNLKDAIKQ